MAGPALVSNHVPDVFGRYRSALVRELHESLRSPNDELRGNTSGQEPQAVVVPTVKEILEVDRLELFKMLPGYENYHAPRSEYLFKALQPELEDLIFLGNSYEDLFDRFEIFYSLTYADQSNRNAEHIWAPPGRFGWKGHLGSHSPYEALSEEAKQQGTSW